MLKSKNINITFNGGNGAWGGFGWWLMRRCLGDKI